MLNSVLLGLVLVGSVNAASPNWRELHNYTFDKFISDFKLNYQSGTTE